MCVCVRVFSGDGAVPGRITRGVSAFALAAGELRVHPQAHLAHRGRLPAVHHGRGRGRRQGVRLQGG